MHDMHHLRATNRHDLTHIIFQFSIKYRWTKIFQSIHSITLLNMSQFEQHRSKTSTIHDSNRVLWCFFINRLYIAVWIANQMYASDFIYLNKARIWSNRVTKSSNTEIMNIQHAYTETNTSTPSRLWLVETQSWAYETQGAFLVTRLFTSWRTS